MSNATGHSAIVKMSMWIPSAGLLVSVQQMGPDFVITDRKIPELIPCFAVMYLRVDEKERAWGVYLPDGIKFSSQCVKIELPRTT